MFEILINRRNFLESAFKLSAATAIAGGMVLARKPIWEIAANVLERFAENQNTFPDYLLKSAALPDDSKEARLYWGEIYTVRSGDTISAIASRVYPDFDQNQSFFINKLRFANGQDRKNNTLIFPGQDLYVPNPNIPTLGFAAGEEAFLLGPTIEDKYWPTKVTSLNPEAKKIRVYYYNGELESALEVGKEFATDRSIRIAAVLDGILGFVPPRVIFELTN